MPLLNITFPFGMYTKGWKTASSSVSHLTVGSGQYLCLYSIYQISLWVKPHTLHPYINCRGLWETLKGLTVHISLQPSHGQNGCLHQHRSRTEWSSSVSVNMLFLMTTMVLSRHGLTAVAERWITGRMWCPGDNLSHFSKVPEELTLYGLCTMSQGLFLSDYPNFLQICT